MHKILISAFFLALPAQQSYGQSCTPVDQYGSQCISLTENSVGYEVDALQYKMKFKNSCDRNITVYADYNSGNGSAGGGISPGQEMTLTCGDRSGGTGSSACGGFMGWRVKCN